MITTKQLEASGYRFYPACHRPYCDGMWQRLFKDDIGIRYGLELWHYPALGEAEASFMCELTVNNPHFTMQIHRPQSIEHCETYMARAWTLLGLPYYEEYETVTKTRKNAMKEKFYSKSKP